MYADRKQIPLEKVTSTVTHSKVKVEGEDGLVDQITTKLHFEGNFFVVNRLTCAKVPS